MQNETYEKIARWHCRMPYPTTFPPHLHSFRPSAIALCPRAYNFGFASGFGASALSAASTFAKRSFLPPPGSSPSWRHNWLHGIPPLRPENSQRSSFALPALLRRTLRSVSITFQRSTCFQTFQTCLISQKEKHQRHHNA